MQQLLQLIFPPMVALQEYLHMRRALLWLRLCMLYLKSCNGSEDAFNNIKTAVFATLPYKYVPFILPFRSKKTLYVQVHNS